MPPSSPAGQTTLLHKFADPALNLVARATAPPGSAACAAWLEDSAKQPVERVLEAARMHDLVLPMARALSRVPAGHEPLAARFAPEAQALTFRALAMAAELVRLVRLFDAAKIDVMALKGPALSQEIFGVPAMRDPGDLDLLCRPEDLFPVDRLLADAGYRRETRWTADFAANDLSRPLKRVFHFAYYHAERDIGVEIHWRWFHIEEVARFDAGLAWEAPRRIPVGGTGVTVPRLPVALAYLALHAAKHECERLKWLNDLAWLLRDADAAAWAEGAAIARRLDMLDLFLAPLIAAERLGAAALPPALAALRPRRAAERLAGMFLARIAHPLPRTAIGTLRQKLAWQRTYWRLASQRSEPARLRLLGRFARNLLTRT